MQENQDCLHTKYTPNKSTVSLVMISRYILNSHSQESINCYLVHLISCLVFTQYYYTLHGLACSVQPFFHDSNCYSNNIIISNLINRFPATISITPCTWVDNCSPQHSYCSRPLHPQELQHRHSSGGGVTGKNVKCI